MADVAELDKALKVLDSSLSQMKWRLRSTTKRRLKVDVLALCTGMRPVVMIDYGGKMPELQEQLCALLKLSQKESSMFEHLRVMVIEDMIYLIHVTGLAEHVRSSLNSESKLLFVDLEHDPPQMITQTEKSPLASQLISIQKIFSLTFTTRGMPDLSSSHNTDFAVDVKSNASRSHVVIDLTNCMKDAQVTVPTLNGWLLGYPVVYMFSKEHITDAIYNLSTKYLRIFQILVCRSSFLTKGSQPEELLSFSVPYDLSMRGSSEPWADAYLAHMLSKWEKCSHAWRFLRMEVNECYPQAIVL
ncbi:Proteasome subunit beta type-4 [Quillaja saponaria]|uniref:Proteasome subunit beta type-4 n=1 Tax=Quillaja saponaria TaxID=32244 RepID=A0AAD7QFT2_QUISA|nr:Proteasome subunit beta type-4 [Quillaja saponaria]